MTCPHQPPSYVGFFVRLLGIPTADTHTGCWSQRTSLPTGFAPHPKAPTRKTPTSTFILKGNPTTWCSHTDQDKGNHADVVPAGVWRSLPTLSMTKMSSKMRQELSELKDNRAQTCGITMLHTRNTRIMCQLCQPKKKEKEMSVKKIKGSMKMLVFSSLATLRHKALSRRRYSRQPLGCLPGRPL